MRHDEEARAEAPESIEGLNQPLRARVEAVEAANRRALEKAEVERERALADLRDFLIAKMEAADQVLNGRIDAHNELVRQHQELQRDQRTVAEQEREKAAAALRVALENTIDSRYEMLRQHVDHNREQWEAMAAYAKEAINKAEESDDKRYEVVRSSQQQLNDQVAMLATRELVDLHDKSQRESVEELKDRVGRLEAAAAASKMQMLMLAGFLTVVVAAANILFT